MSAIKAHALDKQTAQKLVTGLFNVLKNYLKDSSTIPATSELEKYLSPRIRLTSNERTVCRNIGDFLLRIREVQKHFEEVKFSDFLEDPIIAENKIVLHFKIDAMRPTGQKTQYQIAAILNVEDGKIDKWTEIMHEKGSGDLEPFQELTE